MAFAKFSAESVLERGLLELGCSAGSFGKIADISPTVISLAFRGHAPFPGDRATHVLAVLKELQELSEQGGGLPISFANPSIIRALLDEKRRLKSDPTKQKFYSVQVSKVNGMGSSWFSGSDERTGIYTTRSRIFSCGMTLAVAQKLVTALKRSGCPDAAIFENELKNADNSSIEFASIWKLPMPEADVPEARAAKPVTVGH